MAAFLRSNLYWRCTNWFFRMPRNSFVINFEFWLKSWWWVISNESSEKVVKLRKCAWWNLFRIEFISLDGLTSGRGRRRNIWQRIMVPLYLDLTLFPIKKARFNRILPLLPRVPEITFLNYRGWNIRLKPCKQWQGRIQLHFPWTWLRMWKTHWVLLVSLLLNWPLMT